MEHLSVRCTRCRTGGDFYAGTKSGCLKKARRYGWRVGIKHAVCAECRGIEYEAPEYPETYECLP